MTAAGVALVVAGALGASAPRPDEQATALRRLAGLVASSVVAHQAEAPAGLYVRGESAELARAFETLLAAELARQKMAPVPVAAADPIDAERVARQLGARSLVRLSLSLENGVLAARGDLLGTWVNFWSGAAPTRPPAPAAALEGATEADAQTLALASLTPLVVVHKPPTELRLLGAAFAHLSAPPAALGAGDLDGDGKAEVVALTDDEVLVFAPSGRLVARRDHRVLPSSPTPCREPFGALAVLTHPARVAYLSSQRAKGELLALDRGTLKPVGTLDAAPLGAVGEQEMDGRLVPGQNTFAPEAFVGLGASSVAGAFTSASVHAAPGGHAFLFVMPDGTGTISVGTPGAPPGKLTGLGAGSALVDVDGDGRPELVTSSPRYAPEADELRVFALNGNTLGPEVWRTAELPKGARVLQVAAADLNGDGTEELLVGLWLPDGTGEIDVFRKVTP